METSFSLTTPQEKTVALLLHLQEDFVIFEDKYGDVCIVRDNSLNELFESYDLVNENQLDKETALENEHFIEWVSENYVVEELEGIDEYSDNQKYRILTDSEADNANDEWMENYIKDCVLPQIPEQYQYYFDEEKFKKDLENNSDRGTNLAGYDGHEYEINVNDTYYYIYRCN